MRLAALILFEDLLLLVAPAVLREAWRVWTRQPRGPRVAVSTLSLAAIPVVAWHVFSLIYYGFLLPNTAYAKLGHGPPRGALIAQGFHYLADSLMSDPVTMVTIVAALVIVASAARLALAPGLAAVVAGLILHVGYIVGVGGDFMSGRFLTPPFLTSVVVLASLVPRRWPPRTLIAVAALLLLSVAIPSSPLRLMASLPRVGRVIPGHHGTVDERLVYYPFSGLIPKLKGTEVRNSVLAASGAQLRQILCVREYGAVGLYGYFGGPRLHLIDLYGLADPLMARLPSTSDWRIGHFSRTPPRGYTATLTACQQRLFPGGDVSPTATQETCLSVWPEINRIEDPRIGHGYHELLSITQGPLFDADRLWLIVRWNLGLARMPPDPDSEAIADRQ